MAQLVAIAQVARSSHFQPLPYLLVIFRIVFVTVAVGLSSINWKIARSVGSALLASTRSTSSVYLCHLFNSLSAITTTPSSLSASSVSRLLLFDSNSRNSLASFTCSPAYSQRVLQKVPFEMPSSRRMSSPWPRPYGS